MTTHGTAASVLIVEDEADLAEMIKTYLQRAGLGADVVHTGPDGLQAAQRLRPDVVILDLGLPGLDGLEVCRQIRTFSDCYVLMVTARDDEVDKIIGLSVGADDYITKPFSLRELVARVQAVLRRPRLQHQEHSAAHVRQFDQLVVDVAGRRVLLEGNPIALTRTEFDLLDALSAQPALVRTRRQILDEIWDENWIGDDHIVDVHIANLRKKLSDDAANPRYIETVRGVGYRMVAR